MKENSLSPRSVWEALYDFLDDIFAAMIPGTFFLSYILFAMIILLPKDLIDRLTAIFAQMNFVILLIIVSVAYSLGSLFQRREIKKVDAKSARYLYKRSTHTSGHSFAFANALTDSYIRRLLCLLKKKILEHDHKSYCDTIKIENDLGERLKSVLTNNTERCPDICKYAVQKCNAIPDRSVPTDKNLEREIKTLDLDLKNIGIPSIREMLEELYWEDIEERYKSYEEGNHHADMIKHSLRYYFHPLLKRFKANRTDGALIQELNNLLGKPYYSRFDGCDTNIRKKSKGNYRIARKLERNLERILYKYSRYNSNNKNNQFYKDFKGIEKCDNLINYIKKITRYLYSDLHGQIDFPYAHVKRYCKHRGLKFARLVDWGDGAIKDLSVFDEIGLSTNDMLSDEINRSKIRINVTKLEIANYTPSMDRLINKNSAHIRFLNSLWYASNQVIFISIPVFLVAAGLILHEVYPLLNQFDILACMKQAKLEYKSVALLSFAYTSICFYVKYSVLGILHYRRVRELTMILETQLLNEDNKNDTSKKDDRVEEKNGVTAMPKESIKQKSESRNDDSPLK